MAVQLTLLKEPKLREPYLISGLPGLGYVAKLSADYLVEQLKAELFGEVYCRLFPPYVLIKKGGVVESLKNELYCWKSEALKHDIILFTGNAQATSPEGQYLLADEVLNTAIGFGVKRLYSIAAFLTDRRIDRPRVYGAVTEPQLLEELKAYGVSPMDEGNVGGTNGLILGLAKAKKIEGICLLGETRGYRTPSGRSVVDAEAARAVLEVLTKMLGIHVDMAPIEDQAKLMAGFIEQMEAVERRVIEQMARPEPTDRYII